MTDLDYEDAVTDSISEGCYTITRTWTASGDGQVRQFQQRDLQSHHHDPRPHPPSIDLHCPADVVLTVDEHCDADIDGVALATASFEDNCELE